MLRGLIFDFDGLIVDTETPEVEVWREIFDEHGTTFPDEYWIYAIGRGADQIQESPLELLARRCGRSVDAEAIRAAHHRRVIARIEAQPPRPGIRDLLEEAQRQGLPAGVASSSRHDWVDGHLARLGLASYFAFTTCADDVPRAKPHPDLYLKACERLGLSASEVIALEDSPNGIAAALAAGLRVIVYPNPLTRQLDVSRASARVDDLSGVSPAQLWALVAAG